jgi:hypothetical protein
MRIERKKGVRVKISKDGKEKNIKRTTGEEKDEKIRLRRIKRKDNGGSVGERRRGT